MATIGELKVLLEAQTGPFRTGMRRAGNITQRFTKGLTRIISPLAKYGSMLTAVAGPAALGFMIKQSFEQLDALAKLSKKLNVLPRQLNALQLAGNLAGIAQRQLNLGLQRFIRRASEAAQGTGTAKTAFQELGINAKRLIQLPLPEQLARVSDAMKDIPNRADQIRIAFRFFDSEGVNLIRLLDKGGDKIRSMIERFTGLNKALGMGNLARIEQANDALTKLAFFVNRVRDAIAIKLAPLVTATVNRFDEWAQEGTKTSNVIDTAFDKVKQGAITAIAWIVAAKREVSEWASQIKGAFDLLTFSPHRMLISAGLNTGIMQTLLGNLTNGALGAGGAKDKSFGERMKAVREEVTSIVEEIEKEADRIGEKFRKQNQQSGGGGGLAGGITAGLSQAQQLFQQTRTPLERYNMKLEEYRALLREGKIEQETFNRAVKQAQQQLETQRRQRFLESPEGKRFQKRQRFMEQLQQEAQNVKRQIETPFQAFRREIGRINLLVQKGFLNQRQGQRAVVDQKERLLQRLDLEKRKQRELNRIRQDVGEFQSGGAGSLLTSTRATQQSFREEPERFASALRNTTLRTRDPQIGQLVRLMQQLVRQDAPAVVS